MVNFDTIHLVISSSRNILFLLYSESSFSALILPTFLITDVPADSDAIPIFRICDSIFSRVSMSDSIECNASTFEMEMKETAYILQNLTQASLGIKMHLNVLCIKVSGGSKD